MKFVFASDSFKGSLSAKQISAILEKSAHDAFPTCVTCSIPLADGGEGTIDSVLSALSGETVSVKVSDPLWRSIESTYGVFGKDSAIIEMATASGLPLLTSQERNPLLTTTYGTGELIGDALKRGCKKIYLALGGSATNDGGIGAMRALGVKFLDSQGHELAGVGGDLEKIAHIDAQGLLPEVHEAQFIIMADVQCPLLGNEGATHTFAAQKGASSYMIQMLEHGMTNYATLLEQLFHKTVHAVPGTGAAGGLGASLYAFLNARIQSGIETVLDLVNFDQLISDADLVITGEGQIDWQSAYGKVLSGVGAHCKSSGVPAMAIVGSMGKKAESMFDHGIVSIVTTTNGIMSLQDAVDRAPVLYRSAADRMFRILKTGMHLSK